MAGGLPGPLAPLEGRRGFPAAIDASPPLPAPPAYESWAPGRAPPRAFRAREASIGTAGTATRSEENTNVLGTFETRARTGGGALAPRPPQAASSPAGRRLRQRLLLFVQLARLVPGPERFRCLLRCPCTRIGARDGGVGEVSLASMSLLTPPALRRSPPSGRSGRAGAFPSREPKGHSIL